MKLYFVPRTRSTRPRWMLEELGVPHELIRLDPSRGETRSDEHTNRHPLQHVPVLETRDGSVFESAAIVLHLADLHPEKKMLGPGGQPRPRAGLPVALLRHDRARAAVHRVHPPQEGRQGRHAPRPPRCARSFSLAIRPLERRFSSGDYLIGDDFSAGDVVVGAVLSWANALGLVADAPNVSAYLERIKERPAFKKAFGD